MPTRMCPKDGKMKNNSDCEECEDWSFLFSICGYNEEKVKRMNKNASTS